MAVDFIESRYAHWGSTLDGASRAEARSRSKQIRAIFYVGCERRVCVDLFLDFAGLSPCAIASAKMLIHCSPDCPTTWAQEGIKFDPAPDVVDLGGRKIELIYVGDTACTVDCSSSGHRPSPCPSMNMK